MKRLFRLAALVVVLGAASSCNLNTNYFSDYSGKNLISGYDFGTAGAWALIPTSTGPAITTYMNWTNSVGTNVAVAPDGTTGYRLEIVNLLPNGDFEPTYLGTGWTQSGGTLTQSTVAVNGLALDRNFIDWAPSSSGNSLSLSVGAALGGNWVAGTYQFDMDFFPYDGSQNLFLNLTGSTTADWSIAAPSHTLQRLANVGNALPFTGGGTATITFNSPSTTSRMGFDNLKVIRIDTGVNLLVRTSLPSLSSASAQLIPGKYVFTIYVKDDVEANQATTPTHNRFYATGLSITIKAKTKSGTTGTFSTFIARSGWSTWTKLTYNLGTVDFVDGDSQLGGSQALTIDLSPTNLVSGNNQQTAGSLLIDQPDFEFFER